jgi:hypothetical protein
VPFVIAKQPWRPVGRAARASCHAIAMAAGFVAIIVTPGALTFGGRERLVGLEHAPQDDQ